MSVSNVNISKELWNDNDTESFSNETYHHLLMEQYKVYVEMTDRISARRVLANVFFLTLHTAILGILGLSLSRNPVVQQFGLLLITLLGLLVLCYAWWRLVQYYRHLSLAKNMVYLVFGRLSNDKHGITGREIPYGPCGPAGRGLWPYLN